MLFISLNSLLLSNAITSKRDKFILYSTATITILLSAFINYVNIFFWFLAKGIGIFGGLFHTTATNNVLHSGTNSFLLKSGVLYITVHHMDMYYYESLISTYNSIISTYNSINEFYLLSFYLPSFYFNLHDVHPVIKNTYNIWVSMQSTKLNLIRPLVEINNNMVESHKLIGFPHFDHLVHLRINLDYYYSIHRFISLLIVPFIIIIGVNVHDIIDIILKKFNTFISFVNSLIKRCSSYFYDPVRDIVRNEEGNKETSFNHNSNKRKLYNRGSDEDEQNNNPNKRPNVKFTEQTPFLINTRDLAIILRNVRESIITFRSINTTNNRYGAYMTRNAINTLVTMRQIMNYMVDNRNQQVTLSGNRTVSLSFLLSNVVINSFTTTQINSLRWPQMFAFFDALNHIMLIHWTSFRGNLPVWAPYTSWNPHNLNSIFDVLYVIYLLESLNISSVLQ